MQGRFLPQPDRLTFGQIEELQAHDLASSVLIKAMIGAQRKR
jgi:hypothetical protein